MQTLTDLPQNLPIPQDDGKCNHLLGSFLPKIKLISTSDNQIDLSTLEGLSVIYFYPMTGRPDIVLPQDWNEIPGARGCTPQSCSFRDNFEELKKLKLNVYGASTQSNEYQKEMVQRLALPYEVLSDENLELTKKLNLPTFEVDGMILTKRVTIICEDTKIIKVFYPVFPPQKNVEDVIAFVKGL